MFSTNTSSKKQTSNVLVSYARSNFVFPTNRFNEDGMRLESETFEGLKTILDYAKNLDRNWTRRDSLLEDSRRMFNEASEEFAMKRICFEDSMKNPQ